MLDYVILTDSGSDLTVEQANELDISLIDLSLLVEGGAPQKNRDVDVKGFYGLLREKKAASTAAVNIQDFIAAMSEHVDAGKDVLYIGFSSGLSSTFSAGYNAAQELAQVHPERKIYAVDTLCASLGQGLIVYLAAKMRLEGKSIEEVRDFVEQNKLNLCHWFTVDDLFFLKRGGRVSAATAVVGTMLGIKPVMHVDNAGKLIKVTTARGRRASIDALAAKIGETGINPAEQTMFICHGDCIEDAEYLAEKVKKDYGVKEVIIGYTGVVIGSHSGPGTLALFYLGTER